MDSQWNITSACCRKRRCSELHRITRSLLSLTTELLAVSMPLCEGRAAGPGVVVPCPDSKCDMTVRLRQGDLMLCSVCEAARFDVNVDTESNSQLAEIRPDTDIDDSATLTPFDDHFVQNGLLYFVHNKCHALAFDKIVGICKNFYKCQEIEAARTVLMDYRRLTKHRGGSDDERRERTMIDIVKLCLTPTVKLPVFYSVDMTRIPPVGVEHVDISALLHEVSALREEVRSVTAIRTDIAAIRQSMHVAVDCSPATNESTSNHAQEDVRAASCSSSAVVAKTDVLLPAAESVTAMAAVLESSGMPPSSAQSFAALASALQSTGMTDKTSGRKPQSVVKKAKPKAVIGRASGSSCVRSVITKRQIDMFVSRLAPDTEDVDVLKCVMNVMKSQHNDIKCIRLQSRYEHLYASYHVVITVDSSDMKQAIDLLNNADLWPEGLITRRYFKPKNGGTGQE